MNKKMHQVLTGAFFPFKFISILLYSTFTLVFCDNDYYVALKNNNWDSL